MKMGFELLLPKLLNRPNNRGFGTQMIISLTSQPSTASQFGSCFLYTSNICCIEGKKSTEGDEVAEKDRRESNPLLRDF